jgi:hypothetical protein
MGCSCASTFRRSALPCQCCAAFATGHRLAPAAALPQSASFMGDTGGGVGGGTVSVGTGLKTTRACSPTSRTKRSVGEKRRMRREPGSEDSRGARGSPRCIVRVPHLDQQSRTAISVAVRIAMNWSAEGEGGSSKH